MNFLVVFVECVSGGFVVGLLVKAGPISSDNLLQFTGLMAFTAAIMILFELTNPESTRRAVPQALTPVRVSVEKAA